MAGDKQRRDGLLRRKIILPTEELRGLHGHTREQPKEAAGLNILNMETGENFPDLTLLSIICSYCKISLDEFFAPMSYLPKG